MGLLNPQIREPGPTPGSAKHWTLASLCAAQRIAGFGPAPHTAQEDFERWSVFVPTFVDGSVVLAFFDPVPKGYESFTGWNAGAFLEALPSALSDTCSFTGGSAELFDAWPSSAWASFWAEVPTEAGLVDDFEAWVAATPPTWATGAAETFEGTWPPLKAL